MADTRARNVNWNTHSADTNTLLHPDEYQRRQLAVLMDVRDELQTLNRLLACPNFVGIPQTLARISRNTLKPRVKKGRAA